MLVINLRLGLLVLGDRPGARRGHGDLPDEVSRPTTRRRERIPVVNADLAENRCRSRVTTPAFRREEPTGPVFAGLSLSYRASPAAAQRYIALYSPSCRLCPRWPPALGARGRVGGRCAPWRCRCAAR